MLPNTESSETVESCTVQELPVMILAGGRAKRLGKSAKETPKVMIDVAGEPFISHQLKLLKRSGFDRAIILTGHLGDQIKEFVGDGSSFELAIEYSDDGSKSLGTGGAIQKSLSKVDDEFAIIYGDSYLDTRFEPILYRFRKSGKHGLMTILKNCNHWHPSNVCFHQHLVESYDKESPSADMEYIDFGFSILKKSAFDSFKKKKSFDLGEVFKELIEAKQLVGYEVSQRFYDIGTPEGLIEARAYLSRDKLWG